MHHLRVFGQTVDMDDTSSASASTSASVSPPSATSDVWKYIEKSAESNIASYPGRVGGERRPGIDCLRMRCRFRYISVKF